MTTEWNWPAFAKLNYETWAGELNWRVPGTGIRLKPFKELSVIERRAWLVAAEEVCSTYAKAALA